MSRRWAAKSPMSGYLVAIAATLVVLLLRLLLSGILGESAYFFPFVIAVTVSAWYGGLKPAAVPPPATSGQPGRILVVDDNKDSAETLSLLLQLMGNEVSVAHDGEQALEMAIELRPAVVLLDIGLPKVNGYEVAREIRAQSWGNDPTLIAITGWGQTEDKDLSKQAGFNHHLVKPVDPDLLLKLIEKRKAAHENHSPAV